ncbi:hypothetical protein V6N11_059991 [Hibiscus sabdariffa]|uniref:Uncharacterized protein n=2 Tax=Hibiscus sabdariffa TaxID=183260 RepID=A0ABR2NZ62_9ROSI
MRHRRFLLGFDKLREVSHNRPRFRSRRKRRSTSLMDLALPLGFEEVTQAGKSDENKKGSKALHGCKRSDTHGVIDFLGNMEMKLCHP